MKVFSFGDVIYLLYPVIPLRWLFALARLRGKLDCFLRTKRYATVRNNLAAVCGENAKAVYIDTMAHCFFEYQQLRALLVMVSPRISFDELSRLCPIEGLEHLDRAVALKKGVVLLGSHLNSASQFLAVALLRKRGYDASVLVTTDGDVWERTALRKFIDRKLGKKSLKELIGAFYCQFNIRPFIQRLKQNTIVLQTGDGWHSTGFVQVEFLHRMLPFTTGMMHVAQLTGAVVVPLFAVGAPPDKMRFVIEEPFFVEKNEDPNLNLQKSVAAYARRLEYHLLQNIACWQHWEISNTLDTMATWPQRPLSERYHI